VSNRIRAFLEIVEANPDRAQTLLVEMVGAGPRAVERRDEAMSAAAGVLFTAAQRAGFGYETELDAFAAVGATVELVSRQLRRGKPARLAELQPVLERLFFGLRRTG
jgi:hypothetical protein